MAMKIKAKANLLTAESKPYEFNGNTGVSHKIRLFCEGEVYECKSTAEQVIELKSLVGKAGDAEFSITSKKERIGIELVSFKA